MKTLFETGWICAAGLALFASGCASTGDKPEPATTAAQASAQQSRYKLATAGQWKSEKRCRPTED